ncbi:MAG: hypothetical protein QOC55_399 [Thermoleophilaceae bacterium]|jgi:hypothetical protein|nr:hypothetical protein [Thermoleophilaceae bacterium]
MSGTRAYIASAGTAAVMLGASLAMLALVSAFVAFGSWPGTQGASDVNQVVLNEVAKPTPKKVAVGTAAVRSARRAAAHRQVAQARMRSGAPAATRHGAPLPAGTPVARVPSSTPGSASAPAAGSPAAPIQQQAQSITRNVGSTTQQVGQQVQNTVTNVQTQVNQVVDQVIGGAQNAPVAGTVNQVTDTAGSTVKQVTDTAGSVLGH